MSGLHVNLVCDGCGQEVEPGSHVWFENTADGGLFGHYECFQEVTG